MEHEASVVHRIAEAGLRRQELPVTFTYIAARLGLVIASAFLVVGFLKHASGARNRCRLGHQATDTVEQPLPADGSMNVER